MAVTPYLFVPPPTTTPGRFGLLSAANIVVPEDETHFQHGVQWQAVADGDSVRTAVLSCLSEDPPREFGDGMTFPTAEAFTLYCAFTVKTVGVTDEQLRAYAGELFAAGEGSVIEEHMWADASPSITGGATDLGSLPLVEAVGALERHVWDHHAGTGILHAPRELAAPLQAGGGLVCKSGTQVQTVLENTWAFGSYPAKKMAVTGPMSVRRTDIKVKPIGGMGAALQRETNDLFYLAERTYVISHDAKPAVVTIT